MRIESYSKNARFGNYSSRFRMKFAGNIVFIFFWSLKWPKKQKIKLWAKIDESQDVSFVKI